MTFPFFCVQGISKKIIFGHPHRDKLLKNQGLKWNQKKKGRSKLEFVAMRQTLIYLKKMKDYVQIPKKFIDNIMIPW